MNLFEDPRETKALKALVAAALHPFNADAEVSEEDVKRFLATKRSLTDIEQKAVGRISCDPLEWRATSTSESPTPCQPSVLPELAAMHREKGEAELDPETLAELERRREEIREKLRKRRENK